MKLLLSFAAVLSLILFFRLYTYNPPKYFNNEYVTLQIQLFEDGRQKGYSQLITTHNLLIYAPSYPRYVYGDKIQVQGRVQQKEIEGKVVSSISNPEIKKLDPGFNMKLFAWMRGRITRAFTSYLPKDEAGLLLGIVLGVKDELDASYYEKLRATGVLHVVAASGTNISIVSAFLLSAFVLIVKRRMAIVFTLVGIVIYTMLSGVDPSIVRAAIMGSLAFGAALFGRQKFGILSLFVAAWTMLVVSPSLLTNVGFQLSVAATLGLIIIKPRLDSTLSVKDNILAQDLTTTLAAQLATLPILFATFSSFAPLSILVNVLVLPTIPFIMIIGGAAALISLIAPMLSVPLLYISYPFLLYFKTVVIFLSEFSPAITLDNMPLSVIAGYYLLLAGLILALKKDSIAIDEAKEKIRKNI